nr:immunoglobulin light chain junction region [Macaca mulatta]
CAAWDDSLNGGLC